MIFTHQPPFLTTSKEIYLNYLILKIKRFKIISIPHIISLKLTSKLKIKILHGVQHGSGFCAHQRRNQWALSRTLPQPLPGTQAL
jgi:hypothetical protein